MIRRGLQLAVVAVASLLVIAYFLTDDHRTISYLVLLSGAIAGFVVGILLSPYDKVEKEWFLKYGNAISLVASGFVVAKLDRVFEDAVAAKKVFDVVFLGRWLLLFSSFLLWVAISFVMRRYYEEQNQGTQTTTGARNQTTQAKAAS